MSRALPDDVLHLICDQLGQQRDFHTLYLCARSSKQLAIPALSSLYRYVTIHFKPFPSRAILKIHPFYAILCISTALSHLTPCSIHDVAPITNGGSDELDVTRRQPGSTTWTSRLAQQEQIVRKWANMWQSIILSCLGKTMYPYCRFIRVLNLRDLGYLFEDPKFRGNIDQYVE
jgi:hypothetical protein